MENRFIYESRFILKDTLFTFKHNISHRCIKENIFMDRIASILFLKKHYFQKLLKTLLFNKFLIEE